MTLEFTTVQDAQGTGSNSGAHAGDYGVEELAYGSVHNQYVKILLPPLNLQKRKHALHINGATLIVV